MQLAGFSTLLKRAFWPGKKFWFAAGVAYIFNVTHIHPVSCFVESDEFYTKVNKNTPPEEYYG